MRGSENLAEKQAAGARDGEERQPQGEENAGANIIIIIDYSSFSSWAEKN
jgi:hypothetical protein